jgi:hypothetical protein
MKTYKIYAANTTKKHTIKSTGQFPLMRPFNDGSFLKIDLGGEALLTAFRAFRMPTQP